MDDEGYGSLQQNEDSLTDILKEAKICVTDDMNSPNFVEKRWNINIDDINTEKCCQYDFSCDNTIINNIPQNNDDNISSGQSLFLALEDVLNMQVI